MPKKMYPIEVLQHYLDDLNSFTSEPKKYVVVVQPSFFLLVCYHYSDAGFVERLCCKSSDFEVFCNKVSYFSRKQVRDYMKGIQYPYKRKVGHA